MDLRGFEPPDVVIPEATFSLFVNLRVLRVSVVL